MKNIKIILTILVASLWFSGNSQTTTTTFKCNFDCPSCEDKVLKNIPYEKGVKNVTVSYKDSLVTVMYKNGKSTDNNIQQALQNLGYKVDILGTPITIAVKGNCGMCKSKIETAAQSLPGITYASWNVELKQLIVFTNDATFNPTKLHEKIASIGYDTDKIKADDEVYSNLHHCCKYER